jgi:hypothetical protein
MWQPNSGVRVSGDQKLAAACLRPLPSEGRAHDRVTRSLYASMPIGASPSSAALALQHPWCRLPSLPPVTTRASHGVTDAGVIAFLNMLAVTPPSIIIRNGTANDIDDIGQDAARHTVDRQPVQMIQLVQEAVDDVVPNVCIPHGVRQRRDEIGKRDHRKVDLLPRLRVFHHAEAIAA